MCRVLLAVALLGLAGGASAQQSAAPWPERLYNPQPAEGDLVLPMPCGGGCARSCRNAKAC